MTNRGRRKTQEGVGPGAAGILDGIVPIRDGALFWRDFLCMRGVEAVGPWWIFLISSDGFGN